MHWAVWVEIDLTLPFIQSLIKPWILSLTSEWCLAYRYGFESHSHRKGQWTWSGWRKTQKQRMDVDNGRPKTGASTAQHLISNNRKINRIAGQEDQGTGGALEAERIIWGRTHGWVLSSTHSGGDVPTAACCGAVDVEVPSGSSWAVAFPWFSSLFILSPCLRFFTARNRYHDQDNSYKDNISVSLAYRVRGSVHYYQGRIRTTSRHAWCGRCWEFYIFIWKLLEEDCFQTARRKVSNLTPTVIHFLQQDHTSE